MDPSAEEHGSADEGSPFDNNHQWYQKHSFDFYLYKEDNEGFVQKVFRSPDTLDERGRPRKRGILKADNVPSSAPSFTPLATTPRIKKASTPVSFDVPVETAPKYLHKAKVKFGNQEYGPTALLSHHFGSRGSEGNDYWYYHQSFQDLDSPLPVQSPRPEGTIFVHRNLTDSQFQLWLWGKKDGALMWQPLDLSTQQILHPKIPLRALKLTQGEPRWLLLTTLETYASCSRSRSMGPDSRCSGTLGKDGTGKSTMNSKIGDEEIVN
ncbi:hypothetical protein GYMLUDRAFT_62289 [Collybiopsis luxurians FD-317 M1]|uniref:Uncharacterized protein n=1 Tax=Collybiopsis luxurians FD-317 M1 TaxID=944289 RepID=A0A0D0CLM1_9AGAR|nr:hypothetical protein GYMLUDRAFT_62289 [Collybiopsis luxurians FD-317 M1]